MITKVLLALVCSTFLCIVNCDTWCSPGEVYTNNYMPYCEPSCDHPNKGTGACFYRGSPGCKCAGGLYRSRSGRCVPAASCVGGGNYYPSVSCGAGEAYVNNYQPLCEPSCQDPYPQACGYLGSPGCQCANGLLRNSNGYCVDSSTCQYDNSYNPYNPYNPYYRNNNNYYPTSVCGPNEEFTTNYAPKCEPTCARPNPGACSYLSHQSGCKCKHGFYRNSQGICVSFCGYTAANPFAIRKK